MYSFVYDRAADRVCFVRGDKPFGFVVQPSRMLPECADSESCLRFLCAEMDKEDTPGVEPEALVADHLRRLSQAAIAADQVKAGADFLPLFGPWIASGQVLVLAVGLREIERHHRLLGGDGAAHLACVLDDMGVEGVAPRFYDLDDLERCIDRALVTKPYESMPRVSSGGEPGSRPHHDLDRARIDALDGWLQANGMQGLPTFIASIPYARAEDAVMLSRYFERVGGADSPEPFAAATDTIRRVRDSIEQAVEGFGDAVDDLPIPSTSSQEARHA